MRFHLSMWHKFKKDAEVFGAHIDSKRNKETRLINLNKDTLDGYIAHITCILLECRQYMDKCGLTLRPPLWKYDVKDPTTQPSNVAFKYKHLMSKQAIKAYGEGFMAEPLPKAKKAVS